MNYLIIILFIFFFSCSKDKDLVDIEYYMKQGKEIKFDNEFDFKEIKKIDSLILSKPVLVTNWLSYKFNSNNLVPRFSFEESKKKTSVNINTKSFLVINKKIYLVDDNSNLIILNENLKELKRLRIYKKKEFNNYKLDFSMVSNGKSIYISDNIGNIHSINAESLAINWIVKLGVPINSDLYLHNSDLFFVNTNSKLYSLKSSNGEINWTYETSSKMYKEKYQISISNNLLISNNDYGDVYCYDLSKKSIVWKLNLKDLIDDFKVKNFKISLPVINGNSLYFSSNFGELFAIEIASGKILWKKLISSINIPIINNDYIFLISSVGYFYILNKNNGKLLYSKNLNKTDKIKYIFNDMILGKDYIYFTHSGNNLIKLDIKNLNVSKSDNYSLNYPKDYFVVDNHLYFLEDKKISKFYN